MAVLTFKLTQKQRKNLSVMFTILNVLQVLMGCTMTCSSFYVVATISPLLHTEKAQIDFAFIVTGIYGTHVIAHWLVGIKIKEKCFYQAHKKSTSNLLFLWYCAGTNTVVILIVISHFARRSSKQIIKSMRNSIARGMIHYLSDSSWKEIIDRLQFNNECCGIDSYENWYETAWLTKYHVDVASESVKNFRSSQENLYLPVIPWSCCRINFPMQCLHDPLQQAQYAHLWVDEPNVVKDSINTDGCLNGIKGPIIIVINMFVTLSTYVFVVHIIIVVISRFLYTSSRNAILLDDPRGTAPGWLFGRGDCGYARGKTLAETMGLSPRHSGLVPDQNEKKARLMNLQRMIPRRLRRNTNKLASDSEILVGDTTAERDEYAHGEVDPTFNNADINNPVLAKHVETQIAELNTESASMKAEMGKLKD